MKTLFTMVLTMMCLASGGSLFGEQDGYVVILLGPPGSGKGTQAVDLSKKLQIPHISVGDLFRKAKADQTSLGQQAAKYMDSGLLVPDDLTLQIVKARVEQKDADRGYILDGFPRTLPQAAMLKQIIQRKYLVVVNLEVEDNLLVKRLAGRGRADDSPETVQQRLVEYHNKTKPLVDFYKEEGALASVEGDQEVQKVFSDILDLLQKRGITP